MIRVTLITTMLVLISLSAIAQGHVGPPVGDGKSDNTPASSGFKQYQLGLKYREGRSVPQSDDEAVKWFRLSAEQGNAYGQSNLGFMYQKGRGVPQSDDEAVKWFRLSAKQGNAYAQSYLGFMYQEGRSVSQSDDEALKWFRLSAEQGDAFAENALKRLTK